MANIIVVGSINSDLVVTVERYPKAGETLRGTDFSWYPGGKGANQAVAAARLGATVEMVGAVGNDPYGEALINSLRVNLVGVNYVKVVQGTSGTAMITVEENGENRIILATGANQYVTWKSKDVFQSGEWLIVQNEIPWGITESAIKLAAAEGMKVLLNPAPARKIPSALLPLIDVLVVNEHEAKIVAEVDSDNVTDEDLVVHLLSKGVSNVLLTLGTRGCMYASKEEIIHIPAYLVTNVVDTTAAGDTFIGAFVAARMEAKTINEALHFATAASAIAITRKGAQSSIPTKEEVEKFIKRNPIR
ncbi:ribokinase [Alkalihalophilus lindianensis]|uniref:Ribokinase n=1 Tax=Alkalihalophilus lindianensis TaxID=1630542 RepID=A0ABU3XD48_9BACI|nr:ribokinase [Alkalihalophilus lindianensis]MDV2685805.1 ribokinase [Alkalihalophilus lindianensis]